MNLYGKLLSDFQQFYNLDIDAVPLRRAVILAANLPAESRCARELAPELEWSEESYILASIEEQLAGLAWALGQCRGPQPKRRKTPADVQTHAKWADPKKVAEKLNIEI